MYLYNNNIYIYIYIRMYVCIYIELMNLHCMTSNQSTLMAHSSTSEFFSSSPSSWPCSAWTPLECVMPTCKRPTMPCKDLHVAWNYMEAWFEPMCSLILLAEIRLGPTWGPTTHHHHRPAAAAAAAGGCPCHPIPPPLHRHRWAPALHRCVRLWCPAARLV